MRRVLTDRLLRAVMGWDDQDVGPDKLDIIGILNELALYKYNQYQQYHPGLQFIESLAIWLNQFEETDRTIALDYVRNRLIFISDKEMRHLVELMFIDIIRPIIRSRVAKTLGLHRYQVSAIDSSEQFFEELQRSMFLGLADGARIDELRRSNSLNNDQVDGSYYLGAERAVEMRDAMGGKFRSAFLVDDFYGSGKSVLRWERDGHVLERYEPGAAARGRLTKFGGLVTGSVLKDVFEPDVAIHIVLYVATEQAIEYLRETIREHPTPFWRVGCEPTVSALMIIPDRARLICGRTDDAFDGLLHKMYDSDILMNKHRKVGGTTVVHGFSNCGLPLIFSHNSPNNSVYLLWETLGEYVALFPRVDRHREDA